MGVHEPLSLFLHGRGRGWKAAWDGRKRVGEELSPDDQGTVRQAASSPTSPSNRSPNHSGIVRVKPSRYTLPLDTAVRISVYSWLDFRTS